MRHPSRWPTVGLLIGLLCAPAFVGLVAEDDFDNGLVLYFPFEGSDEAITDESGSDNHGEFVGALRTDEGKFGKAIEFPTHLDGATIPDSPSLLVTDGFTASVWVYATKFNLHGNRENRVIKRVDQYTIDLLLGKGRMEVRTNGAWAQVAMAPEMPLEEWHMITGTWSQDDGEGKLYRDGFVVKINPSIPSIEENKNVINLGVDRGLEAYVGRMDEVRIWNRALSEDEVEALFTFEPVRHVWPAGKLALMWGSLKHAH